VHFGGHITQHALERTSQGHLVCRSAFSGTQVMNRRNGVVIPGVAVPLVQQFSGSGMCRVAAEEPPQICQEVSLDLCGKRTPTQPVT